MIGAEYNESPHEGANNHAGTRENGFDIGKDAAPPPVLHPQIAAMKIKQVAAPNIELFRFIKGI
jgi:hypothetical protein